MKKKTRRGTDGKIPRNTKYKQHKESTNKLQRALRSILDEMDVPSSRKDISNEDNLRWLDRNLHVRNLHHPKWNEACKLLQELREV